MKPTIMKFGGTSVEGATAFQNAARIVSERRALRPVVVVSAMAGFTDALLASVQQALDESAPGAAGRLEKHFDRHLRVIEALLTNQASRMRQLVDQSRSEIGELLKVMAIEVDEDHKRRKRFADAVASYGERLSAAMLAAVLVENQVSSTDVDARLCIITDDYHSCAAPLMDETFRRTQEQLRPLIDSSCIPVLGGFIG